MINTKNIFYESLTIVFTGLLLAYPVSVIVIYLCIDVFKQSSFIASTINVIVLTIVAIIRVFLIRLYNENKKEKL
jgi:uncharacterized membrane protein YqjE|tara:strand:- start:69 stop:293 length:225 start_codon:yes stop_codon:yes gene_type:complete